ncbi:MAG: nucleotidyltransferase family protein [Spirochaetales bacterium]|nr:nucleotidyltransferase family protein [Spirochaetales bacterium]
MNNIKKLNKESIIEFLKHNKQNLMSTYGVKEIGLYGSYAHDKNKKASDIDLLVEFKKDCETFDNYMDLKFFFEDAFNKKIDLVIKRSVKEPVKDRIYKETIYA